MGWHVVQGMYYYSYGATQPHTLLNAAGKNHAVILFKITQGLISTDRTCNGGPVSPTNPEVHIDVAGVNVIFAGKWGSAVGDAAFVNGGQARLFFDKADRPTPLTAEQIVQLEKIFKGQTANPSFEEFASIPAAGWRDNAALTLKATIDDNATTGAGTYKSISLPAQNIDILLPNGTPAGTTKPLNPAQMQLNPLERNPAKADKEFHRLVNAAPKFRLGGQYVRDTTKGIDQSLDVEGTTLANSANSFFVDPDLGLLDISGNGEYRSFLYAGADTPEQHSGIMELLFSTPAIINFAPLIPPTRTGDFKPDPIKEKLILE